MSVQVRQVLREATATAHQRLHDHPVLAPLNTAAVTRVQYIRGLTALYGLHAAADRALAGQWPERASRAAVIAVDLQALGVDPGRLAAAGTLPDCETAAALLGKRYVVDGSGFGTRSMAANIQRALDLGAGSGAGFFHGEAIDQAGEWRRLLGWLEALAAPEERGQACDAAVATFTGIERWLDQCAVADDPGGAGR